MSVELLKEKIRHVTSEDRDKLPVYSYSRMEVFKNCPYQYNIKYNEKKYSSDTTIALELGTLCHYILEQKGKMLLTDEGQVDYNKLTEYTNNGTCETDDKTTEAILGLNDLKTKYFEEWYEPDNASGKNYEEKMQVFDLVLHKEMELDMGEWKPYLFEHHFEFVWDNRIIIAGFIDRIDAIYNDDNIITALRTIDYKTSKKVYDKAKLATSLQFGIYALAILNEFGILPKESVYRFILIDEIQRALTIGWEKRLIKAIDKLLDQIDECDKTGLFKPSPCPLCYWCNYAATNPKAHQYKNECNYYSLWTPTQKTFALNEQWYPNKKEENTTNIQKRERKLIF